MSKTPCSTANNKHHKSQHIHNHYNHQLTMVNKNVAFPVLSAKDRKERIGQVFISNEHVRYVTLYPEDQFICPWCGTTSKNPQSMKKHWERCEHYLAENPSSQDQPRPVAQRVVAPIQLVAGKGPRNVSGIFGYLDIWTFCLTFHATPRMKNREVMLKAVMAAMRRRRLRLPPVNRSVRVGSTVQKRAT
jgi:hypothetical protein